MQNRPWLFFLLILIGCAPPPTPPPTGEVLVKEIKNVRGFEYTYEEVTLSFTGGKGFSLYLAYGNAPSRGGIFWLDVGAGERKLWARGEECATSRLVENQFILVSFDLPLYGERNKNNTTNWSDAQNIVLAESMIEFEGILHYLESREDISIRPVGIYGHSICGVAALGLMARYTQIEKAACGSVPPAFEQISPFTPATSLKMINRGSLFFGYGKQDTFFHAPGGRKLFALSPLEDKKIQYYQTGHALNGRWIDDAIDWLMREE